MNYYIDTELLEGTQSKRVPFLNFKYRKTKNTIDLISIGIVSEDGREYYAISKDFNLKEAWNRYDKVLEEENSRYKKIYWIRDNILFPIFKELYNKAIVNENYLKHHFYSISNNFNYNNFKNLINWYGKSNEQIAKETKEFCIMYPAKDGVGLQLDDNIQFYAYYADYDWVIFCWLFGKMIDLPKGFPMYCRDLKQILDEKVKELQSNVTVVTGNNSYTFKSALNHLKSKTNYPKQDNKHNALDDAKWNKKLHEFLKQL